MSDWLASTVSDRVQLSHVRRGVPRVEDHISEAGRQLFNSASRGPIGEHKDSGPA